MESEPTNHEHDDWKPLKIGVVIAIFLWAINFIVGLLLLCAGDAGARLGDSFGIVSALFSSLAVAGALYTVFLQQREFREARKQAVASEAHQKDVATTQAFSAYVQCLASCSQLTFLKYKDTAARIDKKIADKSPIPDLTKVPPDEYEKVTQRYEELLKQKMETLEIELRVMESFHETTNSLLCDLSVALETIKKFPNIAGTISQADDSLPANSGENLQEPQVCPTA